MNKEEQLKIRVDGIISTGSGDPEVAHSMEDRLLKEIVMEFAPDWVKREVIRLGEADFPRWYA